MKKLAFCVFTMLYVGLFVFGWCARVSQGDESSVHLYEDGAGGKMWYRLYLPEDYDENVAYPLTMFMHGSDGSNIRPVTNPEDVSRAPDPLVSAVRSGPYTSILMAPQLEAGDWGRFDNDRLIFEALESIESTHQVREDQRYVTGLSFGGYGTWHMINEYPEYFAAGVPIAGSGNPNIANTVKNTPVWVYHGDSDGAVDVRGSRVMVESIRQAGGTPQYTELPFRGHQIWDDVYDVDFLPPSATLRLDANTTDKTFRLTASVPQLNQFGLSEFEVDLLGVESIRNLAPKSDFTTSEGTSLAFTDDRSEDNQLPISAKQKNPVRELESVVLGFGQTAGSLPGAGTGEGEVQPSYDAPLLLAEGTYSDLELLDFATFDGPSGLPFDVETIRHSTRTGNFSSIRVVGYVELLHDSELIYRSGSHMNLYPWLFEQRLVPEPSGLAIAMGALLVLVRQRRLRETTRCKNANAVTF